jgi:hypothetical protein
MMTAAELQAHFQQNPDDNDPCHVFRREKDIIKILHAFRSQGYKLALHSSNSPLSLLRDLHVFDASDNLGFPVKFDYVTFFVNSETSLSFNGTLQYYLDSNSSEPPNESRPINLVQMDSNSAQPFTCARENELEVEMNVSAQNFNQYFEHIMLYKGAGLDQKQFVRQGLLTAFPQLSKNLSDHAVFDDANFMDPNSDDCSEDLSPTKSLWKKALVIGFMCLALSAMFGKVTTWGSVVSIFTSGAFAPLILAVIGLSSIALSIISGIILKCSSTANHYTAYKIGGDEANAKSFYDALAAHYLKVFQTPFDSDTYVVTHEAGLSSAPAALGSVAPPAQGAQLQTEMANPPGDLPEEQSAQEERFASDGGDSMQQPPARLRFSHHALECSRAHFKIALISRIFPALKRAQTVVEQGGKSVFIFTAATLGTGIFDSTKRKN